MARGSAGESVLAKHLRILDVFDARRPFRTLTEIADAAGLAPSTAHRLVAELEREGLVERLPDRSYRLGLRLWEYASRTPGALGLRELARPWLEALHARVRQHAQLGVLSGLDVLFIERLSAPDAVVNATLIGGRTPLALSSSGVVLLAHADEALLDRVVAQGWPRPTATAPRDGADLRDRVRRARAAGFAVSDGWIHEDSRGIAVPVTGPHGVVYAALGLVVPNGGAPDDAGAVQPLVEVLTLAAAGLRRALEQAYLPDDGVSRGSGADGIRPLLSTSRASLEYLSSAPSGLAPRIELRAESRADDETRR